MKTKLRRISKRTLSIIMAVLILFVSMAVGSIAVNAGNVNTGYIFFYKPSTWTTTGSIQLGLYQNGYLWLSGSMTKVGDSDLYYVQAPNHSSWSNEQIMFMANSSSYGSGSFDGTNATHYTAKITQSISSSKYYLFTCANQSKNGTLTAKLTDKSSYTDLQYTQKANIYTNTGSGYTSSYTGGTVSMTGYYFASNTTTGTSSDSSGTNTSLSYNAAPATSFTMTATAKTGYDFIGWFSSTTATTATSTDTTYTYTVTGATTLYARFAKKTYTITYKPGTNGTGPEVTDTKTYGTALTLKDAIFTRTGYTQTGWNTNSSGSGGTHYALSGSYTANAAVTLYPEWTANTYTITYKDGGNTDFSGTHASGYPTSHTYGTATSLKTATKTGYDFGGWYTTSACTGTAVTSLGATTYTSDITLYAKWTLKTYKITLSESGATGGTLKVDNAAFTSGSTVTHGSHSFRVDAPSGYKITAISGIGTWTNNSSYATLGSTSITEAKTISVTYAVSGSCGFTLNKTSASINIGATTSFTATPNSYHSSGTISASSSNTSVATVSKSGNTYTVTAVAPGTANITVSCTDSDSTPATFTVTVNTPTITVANKTGLKIGESYTPSPTLTNPSSTGSGWTVTYSKTTNNNATTISSSTITGDTYNATGDTYTAYFKYNNTTKASTTFTVKTVDPTITMTTTAASINVGATVTRTATGGNIGSGATGTVSYSSNATGVATVDSSGKVTGITPGTATITATYTVKIGSTTKATKTASYTVTVNTPTVSMSNQTVAKGDSVTFSATTTNPTGLTIAYSLKSAVSGVSINSSTGVVTVTSGCTATSATVVATAKNSAGTAVATKEATLTIQAPSVTLTNTNIADGTTIYAAVGTNVTSNASNNFSGSYTVSSSKTSVATVTMNNSKLTITPVAKGKTTITVTATKGSISVTKTFTVKVAAAVTDQLILFTNNYSWSSVYIYYQYNSNGTQTVGLTQMTKIGKNENNQDVYGYNMPIAHYNNLSLLIFASDTSWNNQTVDITSNLTTNSAYYISGDGTGQKARTVGTYTNPISVPQISADDIADLPINTSTSMTADLLNNVTPSSYTWTRSSTSYLTLANASTTSNSNTLTGVYPGTTTITIRAYSPLPTNWTFETTDGAAALIAGTATATVTTTATPKSVTWGNKVSTDNGSTYVTTNASGAGTVTVSPTMTNGGTVAHGTEVTFSATVNSGYKFAGWQVNGTNSITSTTTKTVQITENTTVYALYYKTYTVTVTKGTGVTSYKTNHSSYTGTYTSNQTFTVNAGTTLNITNIVYANGYEADSTNSSSLTNSNIQENKTPVIAAKKKSYTLTGQVSPTGHGSVKFYSDSACTTQITTAQINDTIYAKYIPSDDYVLKTFTVSGTGASTGTKNGNVQTITMGYGNLTVTANVILEYSVTYYVDMHSSSVTSLSAAVVTTSGGGTIQTDSSGAQCTATLSKQGDSSVYAATINTPVTQSGSTYNPVYLKITYNGTSYVNTLISANVQTLAGSTNKEVWLEAANESAVEKRVAYATNTTTSVTSGNKRIYLAKPYDWQTSETAWENIGLYHWGDYADMGWANAYAMHYIGHDSNYHYYYYDIPTEAKYIIFQGWGSNTSFNLQAQTEDIELSTNYYVLSHDGAYKGTAGDNVSTPAYTRYATTATMNKGDTASIAPTTSNTVKYVTSNSSVATVSNSETTAGTVTAEGRGTATITVKVLGTIGSRVYSNNASNPDMMTYTTSVTVKDPSHFGGFNIMSLESNTSTITIPTVNSNQPGYFDDIAVTVSGLANSGTYTNSAIVTATNETVSVNGSNVSKPVTYTVKYAKENSTFSGYSAISVTADVVSKSIRYSGANRYGYKQWTITPSGDTVPTATTKVDGGIETATTKGITLLGKTYSEIFEVYSYVDVTFTFNYYTYKTKRTVFKLDDEGNKIPKRDSEGAIIEGEYETEEKEFYQYDADYIDPDNHGVAGYSTANDAENRNSSNFDASKHELATYTVTDFEVRGKTSANITAADLYNYTYNSKTVTPALNAIADMPDNDYYSYRLNASTIKTPTANGTYKANVTVELLHAPKKYVVKLNGSNVTNGNDGSRNEGTNYYFYQEYATLSSGDSMNWCVTDVNNTSTGTPLATGKSYKFRVAGNTYIKSVAASIADADFNRSKVTNAGQQITHEAKSSTNQTVVEKLTNNFYISDFFVPEFVKNERDVQEDDVKFVGGGVVYYQVKDGVVDSKVEDAGYADSSGVGVKSSIADFIQEKIEEASIPNEIQGDDLRNEIAYGTEIAATADSETGLRYRYLPYNVFTRDNGTLSTGLKDEVSGNVLVQQLDSNNNPVTRTVDGENVPVYYTFATETSSDTFRYSNTLRAYQYIYADKKENKATNAGKNMRLYSYYIYSYTDYDKDTGIPSTVYKVVLSNEYADASTYWNNTNTNN